MTKPTESAQMVFERINRRRTPAGASEPRGSDTGWSAGNDPHQRASGAPQAQPLRVDEVLFEGDDRPAVAHAHAGASVPGDPNGALIEPDVFPRSATMRFVLEHPALALGIGAPAAALLLRSRESRRLLGLALQIGMRPDVHRLIGASAAALRLTQDKAQKKAP